jgi:PadR family transcriptional regulator PadR
MGKTGVLGSFEELVLLSVLRQGHDAYGVTVRRELAERTGSDVTMGAVYSTLDRLQEKGFVTVTEGERHESRRGRPRRYYALLPAGVSALDETRRIRASMWRGVDLAAADPEVVG